MQLLTGALGDGADGADGANGAADGASGADGAGRAEGTGRASGECNSNQFHPPINSKNQIMDLSSLPRLCSNLAAIEFILKKTGTTFSFEVEPLSSKIYETLYKIDGCEGPDIETFLTQYFFKDKLLQQFVLDLEGCIKQLKTQEATVDMWNAEYLKMKESIMGWPAKAVLWGRDGCSDGFPTQFVDFEK